MKFGLPILSKMNQRIQDFWSPYWNRDTIQDQTDDDQWKDSLQIIEGFVEQQPEISIPVVSLEAWRAAIQKQQKDLVVSRKQN